jgi:regulator of sirC expression with transglutaminase-like and TPR domain
MTDPHSALEAIGQLPDAEIEIAQAALQLARIDAPGADHLAASAHLSDLARAAAGLAQATGMDDPAGQAAGLAALLGGEFGYQGDSETYDDLANANLIRVTERRRGLPVALGIIWLHAARAAGWEAYGVDFPGHFLVALQSGGNQVVVDVFAGGARMDRSRLRSLAQSFEGPQAELRAEMLRPMSTRAVLLRLQNNIKLRRLRAGDMQAALATNTDMLRIAPDEAALWRDSALLHAKADEVSAALAAWVRFLALVPTGITADHARAAMAALRARLN